MIAFYFGIAAVFAAAVFAFLVVFSWVSQHDQLAPAPQSRSARRARRLVGTYVRDDVDFPVPSRDDNPLLPV